MYFSKTGFIRNYSNETKYIRKYYCVAAAPVQITVRGVAVFYNKQNKISFEKLPPFSFFKN